MNPTCESCEGKEYAYKVLQRDMREAQKLLAIQQDRIAALLAALEHIRATVQLEPKHGRELDVLIRQAKGEGGNG